MASGPKIRMARQVGALAGTHMATDAAETAPPTGPTYPTVSEDNHVARFDGVNGSLQGSQVIIEDNGRLVLPTDDPMGYDGGEIYWTAAAGFGPWITDVYDQYFRIISLNTSGATPRVQIFGQPGREPLVQMFGSATVGGNLTVAATATAAYLAASGAGNGLNVSYNAFVGDLTNTGTLLVRSDAEVQGGLAVDGTITGGDATHQGVIVLNRSPSNAIAGGSLSLLAGSTSNQSGWSLYPYGNGVYLHAAANHSAGFVAIGNSNPGPYLELSAGQISFPSAQNPSTNPNFLDDYEEFTFTPSLLIGGNSTDAVYNVRQGSGIKIGRVVTFRIRIDLATRGSFGGAISFGSLPFTAANSNNVISFGAYTLAAGIMASGAWALLGDTAISPMRGDITGWTYGDITNTSVFYFGGSYLAAS